MKIEGGSIQFTTKDLIKPALVVNGHLEISNCTFVIDLNLLEKETYIQLITFNSSNITLGSIKLQFVKSENLICTPSLTINQNQLLLHVNKDCQSNGTNMSEVAGICVGTILGLSLLIGIFICYYKKKIETQELFDLSIK
eukprot:TRINITY_DN13530_c0_g2_i1.p1 TRINITY_DN13530_c0_g2~~TRINITY_DN13530_c0_g2_i1.p1  ORF type:complete len:148 (+),score=39.99 TRINITY_DN13530_c0_g2_i1:25-444(+)